MNNFIDTKITAAEAAKMKKVSLNAIHKYIKQHNLKTFKSQNRVFFGYETASKIFNFKFKKQIISFQIVKGGTGKTTLAHSFALKANLYGAKVLCIDIDQQANLTTAFNVKSDEYPVMIDIMNNNSLLTQSIVKLGPGLDLIPSRIENAVLDNYLMLNKQPLDMVLMNILNPILQNYDIIIIDCPPSIGQSVTAATLVSDLIVCPVTPEQFSLSGLEISYQEIETLKQRFKHKLDFKIVLNKFNMRTALSNEVLATILNHETFRHMILRTFVRVCQDFPNSIFEKSNIFANTKPSSAKEDVDLLTQEILNIS